MDAKPKNPNMDDAIDAALDAATAKGPERPKADLSLKRQWDEDLESQLEAALSGFDPKNLEIDGPRTRYCVNPSGLATLQVGVAAL